MFACIHARRLDGEVSTTGDEIHPLADFAYSYSPLVEPTSRETVVIDVSGCDLHFGSPYALANQIAKDAQLKPPVGLESKVNVALAGNPDAAILAARYLKGVTFIAPGEELTALRDLPIDLLRPMSKVQSPKSKTTDDRGQPTAPETQSLKNSRRKSDDAGRKSIVCHPSSVVGRAATLDLGPWTLDYGEVLATLKLWGVRTFKEFAALPVSGVSERLGQTGLKLQKLAGGQIQRHLQLRQRAPQFNDKIELDYPLTELEPLS